MLVALFALSLAADAKLADHVVDAAAVKDGDVVVLTGGFDDAAMLQDLYLGVGKKGGAPLLFVDDEKLGRKWFDAVPEANDKVRAAAVDKLIPLRDVVIAMDHVDDALFADVPIARRTAMAKNFEGFMAKAYKRGTRFVFLGNGLYPTKANAKFVGVSEGELKKLFEAGLAVESKALAANGDAVKAALPAGKEISVKTAAGTDVKVTLAAKPMLVSDGAISAEEIKAGGGALSTWLPAGEAYGLLEAGKANGTIVVPRFVHEGAEIKDLTATIKDGKVAAWSAKPGKAFDAFKASYDAAGAGKDAVGIFDVGLNPGVKAKGKALMSFVPAGNVTVFVGGDGWAGGANTQGWGTALFLTDATVTVDGKVVVEKGELKVATK